MNKMNKFQNDILEILNKERFKWILINGKRTEYIISSFGRIFSLKNEVKVLTPWIHKDHYYITLRFNNKNHRFQVHRLVAFHFIPNPDKKPIVHHLDKNPLNNNIDNLLWVTEEEHKFYHKDEMDQNRPTPNYGSDCNLSVYKDDQIIHVCKLIEENKLKLKEISMKTGVKLDTVRNILNRRQWLNISKDYDFSKYDKYRKIKNRSKPFDINQLNMVRYLIENGESNSSISRKTGLSLYSIENIRNNNRLVI